MRETLRWLATVGVAVLALIASGHANQALDQLKSEGKTRRDQACLVNEKKQREKVRQLSETYRFLLAQKAAGEDSSVLYRFIVAALPQQEKNALLDEAAPFCDEPGIGLPEPDPRIPKRPAALK